MKSNQRKEGIWILYTDFICYHFYASFLFMLACFLPWISKHVHGSGTILFIPFVTTVNSDVIASSILSSYIFGMMTQSKNKFETCSKACWKTLPRRWHIDDATKQGRSNKLWYGSQWGMGHTADMTHMADGTCVGNVTYVGNVTCMGNVTYTGNVTYLGNVAFPCEEDYGDI